MGPVKKITVYEFDPNGTVQIKFEDPKHAEACIGVGKYLIQLMNERWFNGKCLECFYWDGKTNYRVSRENLNDQQKRIDEFGKWLEGQMIEVNKDNHSDGDEEDDDELGDGNA